MRTYDAGGTFGAAAEIFSKRLKDLFLAALIPVAVVAVAGIFLTAAAESGSVGLTLILLFATLALAIVAGAVATATCFRIVDAAYNGQEASLRESIDFAMSRIGQVLLASILVGLAILVGFIACIAPGIFLAIAFSVTMPALLVERLGATDAMSRSFALVQGRWWATLGRLLLAYLVIWIANFVVGIFSAIAGDSSWVVDIVLGIPVTTLTTGFAAAISVVVYYDLRARKEGAGMTAFPPVPVGAPVAGAPVPPPTSVAPPGAGSAATPMAPPIPPPVAPPVPPSVAPSAPDAGTSASTGSLWSAGDPLQPPPEQPPWAPPTTPAVEPEPPQPGAPPADSEGPPGAV